MRRKEANWVKIGNLYYQEKFVAFDMGTTGFSTDDSQIILNSRLFFSLHGKMPFY